MHLLQQHQICKDYSCHSLYDNRCTKGETCIMTSLHLKSIHLTCREIESLLSLADLVLLK